jgi:hypothetical protein
MTAYLLLVAAFFASHAGTLGPIEVLQSFHKERGKITKLDVF